jgi:diguanylate cyclase (GGDEF)-like protein/PAS domain S-box-containing protein
MSIRVKLILFFILTLLMLSSIVFYAAYVYRETIEKEGRISESSNKIVELSHHAETNYISQLNHWKNVLLRGSENQKYHEYLQQFYASERTTRATLKQLRDEIKTIPRIHTVTASLIEEHKTIGKKFREALRVYNDTEFNSSYVTDKFIADFEERPIQKLEHIISLIHDYRLTILNELKLQRQQNERWLLEMVIMVLLISFLMFLWLIDKNVARPAEHAGYLAEVINSAQHFAKFGSWDWDSKSGKHFWSDGLYKILDINKQSIPSQQQFISCLHEDDRHYVKSEIERAMTERKPFELEARIRLSGGRERVVQQRGQVFELNNNQLRMTSIVYDITERKESEKRLSYLANYDTLTGLPNRNLFQDRLNHAIAQAQRYNHKIAILYLDLDKFKSINDALGHHAGDTLLIEAAKRIKSQIREGDTAARLGGDEFIVVLEQLDTSEPVAIVAEHVLTELNESYEIDHHEVFASASMGITFYPDDGNDVETLLKHADAAMYLAKEKGRNTYYFYTDELNKLAHERLILENSLRMALEREQFQLFFQPQIELSSGRIIGAETLLRWMPDQNMVSPARFIPVLEDTGMIIPVGEWVLQEACRTAKQWQQRYQDFRIAVNLSVRQLRQANIVDDIETVLSKTQLQAKYLEIELTESTLIDKSISQQNLANLEKIGVTLAIDDFGTGYSSLSYLQQFSVDVLKIDRSFIKDITHDRDDDAVTSAIIALSHKLDMIVIAEGIETAQQMDFLVKANCDQAQGFMIGRPMPKHQFEEWIESYYDNQQQSAYWHQA